MARTKSSQSKHDAEVKDIARDYEKKGWSVEADVKGYRKPDTIGGYRPDVVAKKGPRRDIVDVETPDSVDSARDQKQQNAFRAAAKRSKNTRFNRKITK